MAFSDLDLDDIVGVHWACGRRGGWDEMQRAKGRVAGEVE